ncbi:DUF4394 domain-containing protein [Streptomyces hypolithicus]
MRKAVLTSAALAAMVSTLVLAGSASAGSPTESESGRNGDRLDVIGLTSGQRLVQFSTNDPTNVNPLGRVSGLRRDTKLVGIDYRVQNSKLYGVGDKGGIYLLNTDNAKATKVSKLTVALKGKHFGVDFNPAANRLRVISDTGQNLRHNIDDGMAPLGTTVDGTLTNPTMPPTTAKGVTGAGYTNNDLNAATATTLFDIDTVNDRVSIQSPANAGNLAPTGNLGVNAGPSAGFDVYYSAKKSTNCGFAALLAGGTYRFYSVNLLDGETTFKGTFPDRDQVVDVALPLAQD